MTLKKTVKKDFIFGDKKNSENLFIERWYQLLRENRRCAAVLPESVFDTTENKYIRLFIYKYFKVKAVVSLLQLTFEPYTSTKTSILFLQKKTKQEVEMWNNEWEKASNAYSQLKTRVENLLAVYAGKKLKAKLPSIKDLTEDEENPILVLMLKNHITEKDSKLSAKDLDSKYQEELETLCKYDKDTIASFGYINTWWVFGEVSKALSYDILMAEADNIGYKRTKRGVKYSISKNDILLSSLRLAKAPVLNFDFENIENFVFSNGFYIFNVKNGWNQKFVLYLFRLKKLKALIDYNIFRGIGISSYKLEDLYKVEICNCSIDNQYKAIGEIEPIEKKIKDLKLGIKSIQKIIDTVLKNEFNFDYDKFNELKKIKIFNKTSFDFSNNHDTRFSAKFHRPAGQYVESELKRITKKN